jgi:hypothetical protein
MNCIVLYRQMMKDGLYLSSVHLTHKVDDLLVPTTVSLKVPIPSIEFDVSYVESKHLMKL